MGRGGKKCPKKITLFKFSPLYNLLHFSEYIVKMGRGPEYSDTNIMAIAKNYPVLLHI